MAIVATRSAFLEARDEQYVMEEGFHFLDEKRVLLAVEIVRQFEQYKEMNQMFTEAHQQAVLALQQAVTRHGLLGMQVSPPSEAGQRRINRREKVFFGVSLVENVAFDAQEGAQEVTATASPLNPSPEAQLCQKRFSDVLKWSVSLAALSGNLHRLLAEYKRTERRARALEDVILPELQEIIHEIDIRLEEMELEEAVRVRLRSFDQT